MRASKFAVFGSTSVVLLAILRWRGKFNAFTFMIVYQSHLTVLGLYSWNNTVKWPKNNGSHCTLHWLAYDALCWLNDGLTTVRRFQTGKCLCRPQLQTFTSPFGCAPEMHCNLQTTVCKTQRLHSTTNKKYTTLLCNYFHPRSSH